MAAVEANGSMPQGSYKPYSSKSLSNSNSNSNSNANSNSNSNANANFRLSVRQNPRHEPIKAYMIYGHGSDSKYKFTVPDGCYIVAVASAASLTSQGQFIDNIKRLCKLQKKYPDILSTPVDYIPELQHTFRATKQDANRDAQSIVIYGPGEKCPIFKYTLSNLGSDCHAGVKLINGSPDMICTMVPINDRHDFSKKQKELYPIVREQINTHIRSSYKRHIYRSDFPDIHEFNMIHLYICMQYLGSVDPSLDIVFDLIERAIYKIVYKEYAAFLPDSEQEKKEKEPYLLTRMYSFDNSYVRNYIKHNDIFVEVFDEITKEMHAVQNVLCDIYPGVYYNFICRSREEVETHVHGRITSKLTMGRSLRDIQPDVQNLRYSPRRKQVLLNRMAEAVKRGRIQKQYYNSNLYREHRHKMNYGLKRSGQKEVGDGILQARITRRRQTIARDIAGLEAEKASFLPTNKRRTQKIATRDKHIAQFHKELAQLDRDEKRIKNNYENFLRHHRETKKNGNYIKVKGKWVLRTENSEKENHISPVKHISPLY